MKKYGGAKIFGKIMFLAPVLADFFRMRAAFLILPRFCLESKLQRKMSAEEYQRLVDFEKRLDGLEQDLGQLKLALGNSDRRFNELENRFDELKR